METWTGGAGGPDPAPSWKAAGDQDKPRIRGLQRGESRRLEILRRIPSQRWRRPEVMLMVGHPLLVLVAMDQGRRQRGLLRTLRMPVVRGDVRSHPEKLRETGSGQEEERGSELSAERHAGIVAHPVR